MTFPEILSEYGVEIAPEGHRHSRPGWTQIDCPFCGKDSHKFHMGYSLASGYCACWKCGFHNTKETLVELTGMSYYKAKELLKDLQFDYVEQERPKGKLTLPKGIKPLRELPRHRSYLRARGYNWVKLQRLWQIQGIGMATRLSLRIFIPIHLNGQVVSWTTRTISKDPSILRYLSASPEEESINHKTLLYGEDYARHAIIIVEGPFDVWRIGPGAVATLGTGFSQSQVNRMTRFPVRCILFDSDTAAQKRAKRLRDALNDFPGETYVASLETGKDAGEADEEELKKLRQEILK